MPGLSPRRVEVLGLDGCNQCGDRDNRFDDQLCKFLGLQPFLFGFLAHGVHLPSMIIVYYTYVYLSIDFRKKLKLFSACAFVVRAFIVQTEGRR